MGKNHVLWALCLFFTKASYVITSYSQLVNYNLNNKLFYENPDFKNKNISEQTKQQNFYKYLNSIWILIIPYFKKFIFILLVKF